MSIVGVFLVGIAVEVDRHDAEIIIGLSHVGLHKFKSMCEVSGSHTARLVDQEIDGLVLIAPDGD